MKRVVASILLGVALVSSAAELEQVFCISASDCISQAELALKNREWRKAEDYAAFAVDWAEPVAAKSTFQAYRLAAEASQAGRRPRMALEWANAGARYRGPWGGAHVQQVPPEARSERQQLWVLRPALVRQVAARPAPTAPTGTFVKSAGRGVWSELTLVQRQDGLVHWVLSTARNGGGIEPVHSRGPAQTFEGEGESKLVKNTFTFPFDTVFTEGLTCTGLVELAAEKATVHISENCDDSANTAGVYVRVER